MSFLPFKQNWNDFQYIHNKAGSFPRIIRRSAISSIEQHFEHGSSSGNVTIIIVNRYIVRTHKWDGQVAVEIRISKDRRILKPSVIHTVLDRDDLTQCPAAIFADAIRTPFDVIRVSDDHRATRRRLEVPDIVDDDFQTTFRIKDDP